MLHMGLNEPFTKTPSLEVECVVYNQVFVHVQMSGERVLHQHGEYPAASDTSGGNQCLWRADISIQRSCIFVFLDFGDDLQHKIHSSAQRMTTTKEFSSLIFLDPTPLLDLFPPASLISFFSSCSHPFAAKTIINYPHPAAPSHPSSFQRWGFYATWLLSNPLSVHRLSLSFSEHEPRLTAKEQINNNHTIAMAVVGHVTEQAIIWICSHAHITAQIKHLA